MTRLTRRASLLVADGYSTVVPVDGRKVRVMNVCLPDTVDPRGAKGK